MSKLKIVLILGGVFIIGIVFAIVFQDHINKIMKMDKFSEQTEENDTSEDDTESRRIQIYRILMDKFDKFGSYGDDKFSVTLRKLYYGQCEFAYGVTVMMYDEVVSRPEDNHIDLTLFDPDSVTYVLSKNGAGGYFEIYCNSRENCYEQQMMDNHYELTDHIEMSFYDQSSDAYRQIGIVKDALSELIKLCQEE